MALTDCYGLCDTNFDKGIKNVRDVTQLVSAQYIPQARCGLGCDHGQDFVRFNQKFVGSSKIVSNL